MNLNDWWIWAGQWITLSAHKASFDIQRELCISTLTFYTLHIKFSHSHFTWRSKNEDVYRFYPGEFAEPFVFPALSQECRLQATSHTPVFNFANEALWGVYCCSWDGRVYLLTRLTIWSKVFRNCRFQMESRTRNAQVDFPRCEILIPLPFLSLIVSARKYLWYTCCNRRLYEASILSDTRYVAMGWIYPKVLCKNMLKVMLSITFVQRQSTWEPRSSAMPGNKRLVEPRACSKVR